MGTPDPGKIQFKAICEVVRAVAKANKLLSEQIYVWLDYSCIPQLNGEVAGVATNTIMSLVYYAMHCSAMRIGVPEALHENDPMCNLATYLLRGWCRAEQAAHVLKNGTRILYILDEQGFRMAQPSNLETYDCEPPDALAAWVPSALASSRSR